MKKKEEIDNVYEKKAQEERAAIMKTKEKKEKRAEPKESRTQPKTTETAVKESPNFDDVHSKPEIPTEEVVSEKKRLEKNSRANPFEEDEEEFEFDIFGDREPVNNNKTSQPEKKKQNIDLDSSDDEEENSGGNDELEVSNNGKRNNSEKEAEKDEDEEDFFGDDFDTEKIDVIKTQIDDIPDSPEIEEDTDQQETCPQE
jgi:hypothetical protein